MSLARQVVGSRPHDFWLQGEPYPLERSARKPPKVGPAKAGPAGAYLVMAPRLRGGD